MATNTRCVLRPAGADARPLWPRPQAAATRRAAPPNKTPPPVTGEQVYVQVCQACHMADAKGGSGRGDHSGPGQQSQAGGAPAIPSA